jgi:hypothetical protein
MADKTEQTTNTETEEQTTNTETEQTTDDVASLVRFVKSLSEVTLDMLLTELEGRPKAFSVYLKRTKEDWLRRYPDCGDDIYNELHPQEQCIVCLW